MRAWMVRAFGPYMARETMFVRSCASRLANGVVWVEVFI